MMRVCCAGSLQNCMIYHQALQDLSDTNQVSTVWGAENGVPLHVFATCTS
jgi:hypothetical protein